MVSLNEFGNGVPQALSEAFEQLEEMMLLGLGHDPQAKHVQGTKGGTLVRWIGVKKTTKRKKKGAIQRQTIINPGP